MRSQRNRLCDLLGVPRPQLVSKVSARGHLGPSPRWRRHRPSSPQTQARLPSCPVCCFPVAPLPLPGHTCTRGCRHAGPTEPPRPRCARHGCGALPCPVPGGQWETQVPRALGGRSGLACGSCSSPGGGHSSVHCDCWRPAGPLPRLHTLVLVPTGCPLALERPALNPSPAEAELCGGRSPPQSGCWSLCTRAAHTRSAAGCHTSPDSGRRVCTEGLAACVPRVVLAVVGCSLHFQAIGATWMSAVVVCTRPRLCSGRRRTPARAAAPPPSPGPRPPPLSCGPRLRRSATPGFCVVPALPKSCAAPWCRALRLEGSAGSVCSPRIASRSTLAVWSPLS